MSETVNNPDPDSFRPQNQRSRTQNPKQTRPQPPVERGWADKADSRPPLRGPGGWGGDWYVWHAPDGPRAIAATALGCMQAGAEKLGVIEASYASAIIGVLSPVSSHCFLSPPAPSLLLHGFTDDWPLSSRFTPHAPRRPPLGPAGSGRAQTLPHWLLPDTDSRFAKDRTGPDLDERPLYIHYVTEPGDSCGKIKPFFPTRHRPTVDHSLVAGGAQRQWLQARLPDGHTAQCLFSTCSP